MKTSDYKAILSAVEQALAICDGRGETMDEMKRKICADLRRVRAELQRELGSTAPEAT
jgi:hypothetical protein